MPSKASFGSSRDVDAAEQREGAVVELHRGALGGLDRVGDLQQAQLHLGVRAEHLAGGDAEEDRVADLAGGAGDCDVDGGCSLLCLLSLFGGLRPRAWRFTRDMDRKSVNHARIGVITALAERQHGVIAAPQLYSLGLSETQVRTRAGNGLLPPGSSRGLRRWARET